MTSGRLTKSRAARHQGAQMQAMQREKQMARYGANVVVDHGDAVHAPVVLERNPTYYNLIGRVEYR